MRKITGILIDPFACTVTEVQIDGDDYRQITEQLNHESMPVGLFATVWSPWMAKGDCCFVDDEGLLKGCDRFFHIRDYHQPLAGKGLILGSDAEGESTSAGTPLATARECVVHLGRVGTTLQATTTPWVKPGLTPAEARAAYIARYGKSSKLSDEDIERVIQMVGPNAVDPRLAVIVEMKSMGGM